MIERDLTNVNLIVRLCFYEAVTLALLRRGIAADADNAGKLCDAVIADLKANVAGYEPAFENLVAKGKHADQINAARALDALPKALADMIAKIETLKPKA